MARYKVEILVVDTEGIPGQSVSSYPTFVCDTKDEILSGAAEGIQEALVAIDKQIATTESKV